MKYFDLSPVFHKHWKGMSRKIVTTKGCLSCTCSERKIIIVITSQHCEGRKRCLELPMKFRTNPYLYKDTICQQGNARQNLPVDEAYIIAQQVNSKLLTNFLNGLDINRQFVMAQNTCRSNAFWPVNAKRVFCTSCFLWSYIWSGISP